MRRLLGGLAVATLLAGLMWTAPAVAAPAPAKAGLHQPTAGLTDVSAQRRYRAYRRYYPRYRYRSYAAPYYYGPGYYPYYRPYYRPGFYFGTPFFGFAF